MLASPLYPAPTFPQHNADEHSQYRPVKDIEAFNNLLPPPIEFVEGSSSGALAVAEGKYEPINGSPRLAKMTVKEIAKKPTSLPEKSPKQPVKATGASLYTPAIDSTWPGSCTVGAGLHNTGNTCFLNSALQCLLHTPPLLRVLIRHSKQDPCRIPSGFCMSCSLKEVMITSHRKNNAFTPYPVSSKLQIIAKQMRRGRQEDSHEFLRYAIDALQKSCLAGHSPKIDPKVAETTWVHKIFGGRLRSRVTCRECGHPSDTFDSILDLSLDIYGASGLKEALHKFVAIDYLKGADKYKCEKCKKAVIAEKRFTLHQAPLVLTIHLKRFSPLGRKIGHHVRYEEKISLQSVMSDGEYGPSYSLFGVICHAGGGPNSGHYIAHVKGGDGRWYEMNDDLVTPTRNAPTSLKSAYILFYLRNKGQALEAAITNMPIQAPIAGVAAGMKKRKAASDDDLDEDTGVKTSKPFIGPLRPSTPVENDAKRQKSSTADPQADLIKKKIDAVSKTTSSALQSLDLYEDDEDSIKESDVTDASSPPPALPPTSSAVPSPSPNPIPSSSFYASIGSESSTDKKRKSWETDDDDEESQGSEKRSVGKSPKLHATSPRYSSAKNRKSSFGLNPYNRLVGNNNLKGSSPKRQAPHTLRRYGNKKKRLLF